LCTLGILIFIRQTPIAVMEAMPRL